MGEIRAARPDDLEAFYRICLLTADVGKDASHLHDDPKLIGQIYSAPYLMLAPELAFAAELDGEVVGYCVGAADTRTFEARLEADWWGRRCARPVPNRTRRCVLAGMQTNIAGIRSTPPTRCRTKCTRHIQRICT